jgi:hypothetical protein
MREKMIELVNSVLCCLPWGEISQHTAEDVADHLIASGVTLDNKVASSSKQVASSKWISVKDRLPDTQDYDWVLAQITLKPECIYGVPVVAELRADGWYDAYDNMIDCKHEKVTHWMPLQEPPKGE